MGTFPLYLYSIGYTFEPLIQKINPCYRSRTESNKAEPMQGKGKGGKPGEVIDGKLHRHRLTKHLKLISPFSDGFAPILMGWVLFLLVGSF